MVCFQDANGSAAQIRNARGKHYVLFDLPADKGLELKTNQPSLGWVPDIGGHPALPFSIAARLILPVHSERDDPSSPLFAEFPTAPLFARLWAAVVGLMDLSADNIFKEVERAAEAVEDQDVFLATAGDWQAVEGTIDGDDLCRWLPSITRGDAFTAGLKSPGLAGAEIFYHVGPYMNKNQRGDSTHYVVAASTLGKVFASDDDEAVCDGAQLAEDICVGLRDCAWRDLFMQVTPGPDDTAAVNARGGQRVADIRNKHGYYQDRLANTGYATQYIVRMLPEAMRRKTIVPCLSAIFAGDGSGPSIVEGATELAEALRMSDVKQIDDRSLMALERALTPLKRIMTSASFASLGVDERRQAVLEKIEATKLTAKSSPAAAPASSSAEGDAKAASGKLLLSQLTKPDALDLLQHLAAYRATADYDQVAFLEWAHSGRWPPEMRAAKLLAATALPKATAGERAVRDVALAAVAANDALKPIGALMQLAWGHVKTLEGYPELQDIYDLGQTRMPDVIARLCARAFSADGASVPSALRFARAEKLTAALKARTWGLDLDFVNDGDAVMLSYIEGGTGAEIVRVDSDRVYTDVSQLLRTRRIGANVLSFFGIVDGATHSWRQLISSCEHAFQNVPASDSVKRVRLGNAARRFVTRSLDDVGKRIDLLRYSAKHDAVGPRQLLSATKGGPSDEFAEAVARIQDDQKRKRSEVADDKSALTLVRLPAEAQQSPALAARAKRELGESLGDLISAGWQTVDGAQLAGKRQRADVSWADDYHLDQARLGGGGGGGGGGNGSQG